METVGSPEEQAFLAAPSSLRAARQPLHEGLNTLQVAASAVTTAEPRFAIASLNAALRYLNEDLLPACRAEESTIFAAVDGAIGVLNSCHVMKSQHTTIIRMAGDLTQVVDAARTAGGLTEYTKYLQPLLHGLYGLCRAHLESEDEAYVGLLEAVLSEAQAEALAEHYIRGLGGTPGDD